MIGLPRFGILPTKQKSSPTKTERGIRLGRFCGALPLLRLIALVNSPTQLGFAANKHKVRAAGLTVVVLKGQPSTAELLREVVGLWGTWRRGVERPFRF